MLQGIKRAQISDGNMVLFGGEISLPISELLRRAHARPDDVVVVAGTIVEGIGSRLSDLDVYVISREKPALLASHAAEHDWVNPYATVLPHAGTSSAKASQLEEVFDFGGPSNLAWNVEYRTEDEVVGLVRYIEDQYADSLNHCRRLSHTFLAYKEKTLVHRLCSGIVIQGSESFRRLCPLGVKWKFCALNFREWIGGYPEFRDVMSAWTIDDLDTGHLVLLNHINDQLFALTFLQGDSNPNKKWLFAKLRNMKSPFRDFADEYLACMRIPQSQENKRAHLLSALDLLDRIYAVVRDVTARDDVFGTAENMLKFSRADFEKVLSRRRSIHSEMTRQWEYKERQYRAPVRSARTLLLEGVAEAAGAKQAVQSIA